jgi:hypothetical protein
MKKLAPAIVAAEQLGVLKDTSFKNLQARNNYRPENALPRANGYLRLDSKFCRTKHSLSIARKDLYESASHRALAATLVGCTSLPFPKTGGARKPCSIEGR